MMDKKLKVVGLNLDISWKNKIENYTQIEVFLQEETADLFILPEMFSTGFSMEPEEIADRNSEALHWMISFAKNRNVAICGSASVMDNHQFYNRFYFVKPDGTYEYYDKRHLFSYSGEDKVYTKGKERRIVEYKGVRFLLQICYDLRFPVFSRNNNDYDAILYVANWPKARLVAWKSLLKARSIENQSYVFGVNRIGTDGNGLQYEESSEFFFADGQEISEKNKNLISTRIHLEELSIYREKFNFLEDRDYFQIDY